MLRGLAAASADKHAAAAANIVGDSSSHAHGSKSRRRGTPARLHERTHASEKRLHMGTCVQKAAADESGWWSSRGGDGLCGRANRPSGRLGEEPVGSMADVVDLHGGAVDRGGGDLQRCKIGSARVARAKKYRNDKY